MPLKLNSSGGGAVTLDVPSTASTFTATVPAITGTVVMTGSSATVSQAMLATGVGATGPAFLVSAPGSQSISHVTLTKLALTGEAFDTANAFDTSTYRFTPLVAGYYMYSFQFVTGQTAGSLFGPLYKNGLRISIGAIVSYVSGIGSVTTGSALLYMNGSTDYIEMYGYQSSGSTVSVGSETYLCGALVRAA